MASCPLATGEADEDHVKAPFWGICFFIIIIFFSRVLLQIQDKMCED